MQLSNRVQHAPESPIRKLVPLADQAKARGLRVFHLNIGQPDIPTPPPMWAAVADASIDVLAYSPSNGIAAFREALVGYYARYDLAIEGEQLLVTTAGSEAILFAMAAICDPGDEVLVSEPFYANYAGYAALLDVKIVPITSRPEDGYALPPRDAIAERLSPRTRAILICNPCNPTGRVYTETEMRILVDLAGAKGIYIISDEVYREFCYADERPISILGYPEISDLAVMVDSLSKRFSACGARIGCLVSRNRDLIGGALKFAQARLSPPTLGQLMGTAALGLPAGYFDEVLAEYRMRRDVILDELGRMPGVICRRPEGAFYVMAKLPVDDAESFVRWILTDFDVDGETLMVAPGEGFYATPGAGKQEVRIAYVLTDSHLRRAMNVLSEGLKAYPGRRA